MNWRKELNVHGEISEKAIITQSMIEENERIKKPDANLNLMK